MDARFGKLAVIVMVTVAGAAAANAGSTAPKRIPLQEQAFPGPGYHTATIEAVLDKGGEVAPHIHPGIEMGYVLSGRAELSVSGQPARSLASGDSFAVPPNAVHSLRNIGGTDLRVISTFVVEAGKPIATPVDDARFNSGIR